LKKIKTGIVNVTGYAGMELARLLGAHPEVEIAYATGRSSAGQKLSKFLPHLSSLDITITEEAGEADVAFLALPHRESAAQAVRLLDRNIKVIDVSADFRLKDASLYPEWYSFDHPAPELLTEAVYGLPELYRSQIRSARLVANPGCYPTSAILALAPALKAGIIKDSIIIDAKSGLSGAGRTLSMKSHFCEANENVSAYALEGHRHFPEIDQELAKAGNSSKLRITFVPHLIPVTRGILSSCYADLSGNISQTEIEKIYSSFYTDEPFVRLTEAPPGISQTRGSNYCMVYPRIDQRTGRLLVISAIDNLIKGAAGQAIQNMNIIFGLEEKTGISMPALYP
jgi:N-acetyl-gamma-glutamyl-phosphate reductase